MGNGDQDENIKKFLSGFAKGFDAYYENIEQTTLEYKKKVCFQRDELKEKSTTPIYLTILLIIYCFIAGTFYVFIKIPQGKIYLWSDWVFYFQIYLTMWAVLPLFTGIHQNYTLGIEKMSLHATKISNKSLFLICVAMLWSYFELNDSRIIFWWLSFSMHFVFLRFLIHLHPLIFYFLTRIPARMSKLIGPIFLLAYGAGIIVSYKIRMEIFFHHVRVGLVLLSVVA